jgi:hypothetical protein
LCLAALARLVKAKPVRKLENNMFPGGLMFGLCMLYRRIRSQDFLYRKTKQGSLLQQGFVGDQRRVSVREQRSDKKMQSRECYCAINAITIEGPALVICPAAGP